LALQFSIFRLGTLKQVAKLFDGTASLGTTAINPPKKSHPRARSNALLSSFGADTLECLGSTSELPLSLSETKALPQQTKDALVHTNLQAPQHVPVVTETF
jgi:hypothetical protein